MHLQYLSPRNLWKFATQRRWREKKSWIPVLHLYEKPAHLKNNVLAGHWSCTDLWSGFGRTMQRSYLHGPDLTVEDLQTPYFKVLSETRFRTDGQLKFCDWRCAKIWKSAWIPMVLIVRVLQNAYRVLSTARWPIRLRSSEQFSKKLQLQIARNFRRWNQPASMWKGSWFID